MHKRVKFIAAAVFILLGAIFLAFRYDKGVFSKGLTYSGLKYPTVNTLKITNALTSSSEYEWLNNAFSSFIAKWELTGASVAIAKDGRLIYARGFGYASKEENIPMEPYNLLRVASVSKLITATAVMKLVEENKIQLDSKVFGPNGILNDNIFLNYKDKRVEDITVKNLLNHSAGWSTRWGDHMFINEVVARELHKELPVSLEDIVVFALSKKLHFAPGSHSSYSNLGYAILELVIEKITHTDYETFVQRSIFRPLSIYDARIAQNWDSLRYPNEARYYEVNEAERVMAFDGSKEGVLKCRGGDDVHTLGAAGGWVISPISLTRFLLAIDGSSSFPDILSKESAAVMTQTSNDKFHPIGWRWVMPGGKLWRSGSLPGTTALAVSSSNGYTYVFISNTSPWKGARFPYIVDRFFDKLLPGIEGKLPGRNLFFPETSTMGGVASLN